MERRTTNDIPSLDLVKVSPQRLTVDLTDEEIFHTLINSNRAILPVEDAAQEGDFVRFRVVRQGEEPAVLQVALGNRRRPEYEALLLGCRTGDTRDIAGAALTVLSIKRTLVPALSDELVRLHDPRGAASAAEYRERYLRETGEELKTRAVNRYMEAILNQLLGLAKVQVDRGDLEAQLAGEKARFLERAGGDLEAYSQALHEAFGQKAEVPLEQCEALYLDRCKKQQALIILGRSMALRDGKPFTEADYRERSAAFARDMGVSEEEARQQYTADSCEQAYCMEYLQEQIYAHFRSQVTLTLNGVKTDV